MDQLHRHSAQPREHSRLNCVGIGLKEFPIRSFSRHCQRTSVSVDSGAQLATLVATSSLKSEYLLCKRNFMERY